tara:strand:+ start:692 stop:1096 length:405 start_codon:yes stop_codon:yes gene_type:complete
MESSMYRLPLLIISTIFLTSCDGNKEEAFECPTIIEPVIISAVRINLFDVNKAPINVCDAILTIDNPDNYQTIYGSAFNNCEDRFSLEGGYNLVEHDVLIEKAGFLNQEFKAVLPIATKCSYETLELDVYLEVN